MFIRVDFFLDKGVIVDVWVCFFLVGIELLIIEVRIVIVLVEIYLKYVEVVGLIILVVELVV